MGNRGGALALAAIGPVLVLLVTWWEVAAITLMDGRPGPTIEQVDALRVSPSEEVLREMRAFAVGADGVPVSDPARVLELGNQLLGGALSQGGRVIHVGAMSAPTAEFFERVPQDLKLCSFLIPGLLVRAFDVSGDDRHLRAALDFVRSWIDFESSGSFPHGLVFNDHAIAARSIVMADLWRAYRSSRLYDEQEARFLLEYVQKLGRFLRRGNLYESRSNHGLMQSLSLLHLAIAFPALVESSENARVGRERIESQLRYLLSREGVILEHSAGYHRHGLMGVAAAGRYLGLLGVALPSEIAERYRKGLAFEAALRRPDGTLPPIGDTSDTPYGLAGVAEFDAKGRVSRPLVQPARPDRPQAGTLATATGYSIWWDGLEHWPGPRGLAQTILHWANFPAGAHKHADELGLSLWADGVQWVTARGFWPYDVQRAHAIGWRSSNAPHWLDEPYESVRRVAVLGRSLDPALSALDVARTNSDSSELRRQLLRPDARTWLVLDSFRPAGSRPGEIVWRFSPGIALTRLDDDSYLLEAGPGAPVMLLQLGGVGVAAIEMDASGRAPWNGGLVSRGRVTESAAIRLTTTGERSSAVAFFQLLADRELVPVVQPLRIEWTTPQEWKVVAPSAFGAAYACNRMGPELACSEAGRSVLTSLGAESNAGAMPDLSEEVQAYRAALARYGEPFAPMTERRTKVSALVLAVGLLQAGLFVFVRRRAFQFWRPLFIVSSVAWVGLTAFLHWGFLR